MEKWVWYNCVRVEINLLSTKEHKMRDISKNQFRGKMRQNGWSGPGFMGYWHHSSGTGISEWNLKGQTYRFKLSCFLKEGDRLEQEKLQEAGR